MSVIEDGVEGGCYWVSGVLATEHSISKRLIFGWYFWVLQCVIIVKFFFQCLIPLANCPLLEYTLNCLASGGVNEVILFCSAFVDQIKSFVK